MGRRIQTQIETPIENRLEKEGEFVKICLIVLGIIAVVNTLLLYGILVGGKEEDEFFGRYDK